MTITLVILLIILAGWAVFLISAFVGGARHESDRQLEIARAYRARRQAEARINRLTVTAMQQMTEAAQRHQKGGDR